jgi:MoxR-like ATPase
LRKYIKHKNTKEKEKMLNTKMLAVINEVNRITAEREELTELIAVALLTRRNLFILGDTGQAKSYVINEFRKRIIGAKQFERLLSKQADEEQLFGRIDLSSLIPGNADAEALKKDADYAARLAELAEAKENGDTDGIERALRDVETRQKALYFLLGNRPRLVTAGKIPDSHIVFLDEIFKANDGVLNSLLTALNERRFTNEGETADIPTISFFAASNEIPNFKNAEEAILKPLYDRLDLKIVTEYVESRSERLRVLRDKQAKIFPVPKSTVTLDELYAMQEEADRVTVADDIDELADDILCELREKGIHVSDRKYFGYRPIAKAFAWLYGKSAVGPRDLAILRHYFWTAPSDRETVNGILEHFCVNPLKDAIADILKMAAESYDDFAAGTEAGATAKIGKFRNEFVELYASLLSLSEKAQSGAEKDLAGETLRKMEEYSQRAHAESSFTYAPLQELFELRKTA